MPTSERATDELAQPQNFDPISIPPPKYFLQVAARNGQAEVIRCLFETLIECRNAEPWDPCLPKNVKYDAIPEKWRSYEDAVIIEVLEGANQIEVFKVFFDYGMSVDLGLGRLGSLLSNALTRPEFTEFLLEKGANPNNLNIGVNTSKSLLLMAAHNPKPDVINLLVEHGACLAGSEALQGAAETRRINNIRRLSELGAEVNEIFTERDYKNGGRSPCGYALHFAIKATTRRFAEGDAPLEIVRLLLENGARTDVFDDEDKTPLEVAKELGEGKIVQLLESYNSRVKSRLA